MSISVCGSSSCSLEATIESKCMLSALFSHCPVINDDVRQGCVRPPAHQQAFSPDSFMWLEARQSGWISFRVGQPAGLMT